MNNNWHASLQDVWENMSRKDIIADEYDGSDETEYKEHEESQMSLLGLSNWDFM
jgi:hypothetical protein